MLSDLDLNELKWDHDGSYWYSHDSYNITPADMHEYARKLEAELEGYKRANEFAKKLHTTVVEALGKSSMENAKLWAKCELLEQKKCACPACVQIVLEGEDNAF